MMVQINKKNNHMKTVDNNFVLSAEFIVLYIIAELIPVSSEICSIYLWTWTKLKRDISAYTIGHRQAEISKVST